MAKPATAKRSPSPVAPSASASPPANASAELKPATDQIRRRAYEIYTQRLAQGLRGSPETDWFQAERELTSRSK